MDSLNRFVGKASIQALLAVLVVGVFAAQVVRGAGLPEALTVAVGMVLAYYFRAAQTSK